MRRRSCAALFPRWKGTRKFDVSPEITGPRAQVYLYVSIYRFIILHIGMFTACCKWHAHIPANPPSLIADGKIINPLPFCVRFNPFCTLYMRNLNDVAGVYLFIYIYYMSYTLYQTMNQLHYMIWRLYFVIIIIIIIICICIHFNNKKNVI